MKKIILLSILVGGNLFAIAQSQQHSLITIDSVRYKNIINRLLFNQLKFRNDANRPTEIKQRVIAETTKSNYYHDSVAYKYSGTRGSFYNLNQTNFFYSKNFEGYDNTQNESITRDVEADSIIRIADGWNEIDNSTGYFRTDDRLDSFKDYSASMSGNFIEYRTSFKYNAQGQLKQSFRADHYTSMPIYDTSNIAFYTYDSNQRLIVDSFTDLNYPGEYYLRKYHYNNQSLVDSINFFSELSPSSQLRGITTMQYTNSGLLQKSTYELLDDTFVYNRIIDTFGYDGNSPIYTFYQHYDGTYDVNGVNADSFRILKFLGNNNLIDSLQLFGGDAGVWSCSYSNYFYYNNYNNPDSVLGFSTQYSQYSRYHFYYETYDAPSPPPPPPVSIDYIISAKSILIYPNPFSDRIKIDWMEVDDRQVKISIVNSLGQNVYSINKKLTKGVNTINLPELPKGCYIFLFNDNKNIDFKKLVIKN